MFLFYSPKYEVLNEYDRLQPYYKRCQIMNDQIRLKKSKTNKYLKIYNEVNELFSFISFSSFVKYYMDVCYDPLLETGMKE